MLEAVGVSLEVRVTELLGVGVAVTEPLAECVAVAVPDALPLPVPLADALQLPVSLADAVLLPVLLDVALLLLVMLAVAVPEGDGTGVASPTSQHAYSLRSVHVVSSKVPVGYIDTHSPLKLGSLGAHTAAPSLPRSHAVAAGASGRLDPAAGAQQHVRDEVVVADDTPIHRDAVASALGGSSPARPQREAAR